MNWTLPFTLSLLLAGLLHAQDWAKPRLEKSPRHMEWVDVKNGDRKVSCFIAFPERKEKATTVLVIYGAAGHGFMRAGEAPDGNAGNRSAREKAWKRWLELLGKL